MRFTIYERKVRAMASGYPDVLVRARFPPVSGPWTVGW
jgi:hypothetical protein